MISCIGHNSCKGNQQSDWICLQVDLKWSLGALLKTLLLLFYLGVQRLQSEHFVAKESFVLRSLFTFLIARNDFGKKTN